MNKKVYSITNLIVLALALYLMCNRFEETISGELNLQPPYIGLLFAVVILVNLLKMARFYFILSGNTDIGFRKFAQQYCKTTPISVIFPLKLGELFRVYCFGYTMHKYFLALLFVIVDRFFDTLALITVIYGIGLFASIKYTMMVQLFLVFIIALVILYFVLPKICKYWKEYLIAVPASERRIKILSGIETFDFIYHSLYDVLRGKGIIAYTMSLLAWIIEIGGAYVLEFLRTGSTNIYLLQQYISAALGLDCSLGLNYFVFATIVLLLFIYVMLHVTSKRMDHK